MAYKFQIGNAALSGTMVAGGDVTVTDELTGSGGISASTNITLAGTAANAETMELTSTSILSASSLVVSGGSNVPLAELDVNTNVGRVRLYEADGSNNPQTVIKMHGTVGGAGSISLYDMNSGTPVEKVKFDGGSLSCSSDMAVQGNLTMAGTASLQGNLTVNGTTFAAQTADVEVTTALVIDAGEGTAADVTGSFIFGDGASAAGGRIQFNSASTEQLHLVFKNGDGSAAINGQANLSGDGSALSNVPAASSLTMEIATKTATAGDYGATSTLEVSKVNVVSCGTGGRKVRLPAISGLSAGNIIGVKLAANLTTTNYCDIEKNGSDSISLDGETTSIRITSPSASFDLVYFGSGKFAIV